MTEWKVTLEADTPEGQETSIAQLCERLPGRNAATVLLANGHVHVTLLSWGDTALSGIVDAIHTFDIATNLQNLRIHSLQIISVRDLGGEDDD